MDKDLLKSIEPQLNQLPASIRDIVLNSNWADEVRNIVEKHNLRIDQGEYIETETFLVIIGATDAEDYFENIKREASLSDSLANEIVNEVELKIFKSLREEIQKITRDSAPKQRDLSRDDLLKDIEDKTPEEIPATSYSLPIKPTTPNNLPTGNIQNVPAHGHNHDQKRDLNVPPVVPQPAPQNDFISQKLNSQTTTNPESKQYGNKPQYKVDPYREQPLDK